MKNKNPAVLKFVLGLLIFILLLVAILVTFLVNFSLKDATLKLELTILGLIAPILLKLFIDLQDNRNWKRSLRALVRSNILTNDSQIRISYAFLFRIQLTNGLYVLVKNSYGTNKFQPCGSTYRVTPEEELYLKESFHISIDDKINTPYKNYRYNLQVKNLRGFYKQFEQKTADKGSLNSEYLDSIKYFFPQVSFDENNLRFVRRYIQPISYSQYFGTYEMILSDIVELNLTPKQETEIILLCENDERFILATERDIKTVALMQITIAYLDILLSTHTKFFQNTMIYPTDY